MHLIFNPPSHRREPWRVALLIAGLSTIVACSGCGSKEDAEAAAKASPTPADIIAKQPEVHGVEVKTVELTKPLKQDWVAKGKATYDTKCLACHKLTADRVVGPGWAGVTKRRQPVWIMNMITNVDMMLAQDAEAQKLLEMCLVRMPNMNVTVDEARQLLEFMRANDGEP
jgi:mono/diheme cytochrome c family protein